jgi:myo-inositol-hexaphosphate 3-phosphohydrolase
MIDKDASFRNSPVRRINFDNTGDDITVYPNPVVAAKLFIASSGICNGAILSDAAGKTIKSYTLTGRNNTLDLSGIVKGAYQLKIFTASSTQTQKIIIQ